VKERVSTRSLILAGGLGSTLFLVYSVSGEQTVNSVVDAVVSSVHVPAERGKRTDDSVVGAEFPAFDSKTVVIKAGGNLLRPTTWWVPPPNVPQPIVPVAPPTPPLLTYKYRGMLLADGQVAGVIEKQGEQSMVHIGDVLENLYRVEDIATEGLTLMYLPLNIKQMATMQDN
jgi:hypothetical protein